MGVVPPRKGGNDYLTILSGASQNIVGIAIAALATFAAQILISRTLGTASFGIVTVATQAAFVLSFATRAGMDMAVLRGVAIEVGEGRFADIRATVSRAVGVATLVSGIVAVAAILGASAIRDVFSIDDAAGKWAIQAAAAGLPFLALTNVWLSATRGLKIMRYTLYVFFAGQPVLWVVLMVIGWRFTETVWMAAAAYSLSWAIAAVGAWWFWHKESRDWERKPMAPGATSTLVRYAGPRAPAALFSQLLFWTDLFVLTRYVSGTDVGIYSAVLRAGQIVVLFLTSVNLMFGPFVADLHNRGETARLDKLFKTLTRWTLAATMPAFLLLAAAPEDILRVFGAGFGSGETALLILLGGQLINIATGSVGFVLIMTGRTGWDLVVYGSSLALDLALAFILAPRYGLEGAAIANALTFAISNTFRILLVKKFVGIQPYDRNYLRMIVPAAVSLAVMLGVHSIASGPGWLLRLVLTAAAGFIAYGGAYLLIGLTPQEKQGIAGLKNRLTRG